MQESLPSLVLQEEHGRSQETVSFEHMCFLALRAAGILTLVLSGLFGIEFPGPEDLH